MHSHVIYQRKRTENWEYWSIQQSWGLILKRKSGNTFSEIKYCLWLKSFYSIRHKRTRTHNWIPMSNMYTWDHWLRVRRALILFKDDQLRTRRVLSMYKVYGDSALLVPKGTSLYSINNLLALSGQYHQLRARRALLQKQCSVENQKGAIAIDFVQR